MYVAQSCPPNCTRLSNRVMLWSQRLLLEVGRDGYVDPEGNSAEGTIAGVLTKEVDPGAPEGCSLHLQVRAADPRTHAPRFPNDS